MRYLLCPLLSVLLFFTGIEAASCAPLQLCFEDVPQKPWTMPDGTGLNIVLLKRVEKMLGERFVYNSEPWKRCIEETRTGVMDGYFASSNTEERRGFSIFPTLPNGAPDKSAALNEDRFDVYVRKDGSGSWDGKKLDSPRFPVLVQRGYYVATLIRDQGNQVKESIKSAEEGLDALAAGRADVAVLQGAEARYLATHDPRFTSAVYSSSAPYWMAPMYLAIGRNTYNDNPKRIEAIWNAIRLVRESADYRALLEAAGTH